MRPFPTLPVSSVGPGPFIALLFDVRIPRVLPVPVQCPSLIHFMVVQAEEWSSHHSKLQVMSLSEITSAAYDNCSARPKVILHVFTNFHAQIHTMEPQPQSQIVQLAYTIAANTKKYDDYLSSHGLPSPSFEVKTPLKLELPDDIEKANNAVVEATSELQALMLGPLGSLLDQSREVG